MDSRSVTQGPLALLARAGLYVAVAYIVLTTSDLDVGQVPLKLFVVALALAGWWTTVRPWSRPRRSYALAIPVLIVGILIPIAWFALAFALHHRHDPAQTANTSYSIQQASRFLYLLLYFPILDEIRRCAEIIPACSDRLLRIHGVWLWPTLALCGITLLFFLGHVLLGLDYGGGNLGPFQGRIGVESTDTFRAYLIDDVMLIPAMALLFGSLRSDGLGMLGRGTAFALLATAYLSHTRGIWLGMIIAAAVMLLLSKARLPLSRAERVVAGLLVFMFLATFLVNADPSASHRAVSFVTQRNELSTSYRLEQAPQLLRGFRRHVVLGSGLGATLPSGFQRNKSEPWSFELSYLQLLFQLGVVGIALLLTIPAWALYRGIRSLADADPERRVVLTAAIGGIFGFLFTSGGNPYLMTSVGMLAMAVLLVMAEHAMAPSVVPAETMGATVVPSRLRNSRAIAGLLALRSYRPAAIVCVVIVIVALGIAEFGRSRRSTQVSTQSTAVHKLPPADTATRRTLQLPSSYRDGSAQLVSDSENAGHAGSTLWSLSLGKGELRASRWNLSSGQVLAGPATPVGPRPRGVNPHFCIASLSKAHPEVLGVITSLKSHIHVELRDLAHAGRALLAGTTPALPIGPNEHRDVGLATWTGKNPDIIVVDRSPTAPLMRVQIFSSTSGFRDMLLDVVVPRGPFSARDFAVLLGAVNSSSADLTLVSRRPTRTSHVEVHVLLGPQAFQTYGEQSPVNLPDNLPMTTIFLLGRENKLPVLYAIDRASGTLDVVQLS
jgi:hypothetical protein